MSKFKKEQRYFVLKIKDIEKYLDKTLLDKFMTTVNTIEAGREHDNKEPLQCVVVQSDWPEYEHVWKDIEDRMNEKPSQRDTAIKLLTKCSSMLFMNDDDPVLENAIDDFLNECGDTDCELNCEECKNCPTSLKPQVD